MCTYDSFMKWSFAKQQEAPLKVLITAASGIHHTSFTDEVININHRVDFFYPFLIGEVQHENQMFNYVACNMP